MKNRPSLGDHLTVVLPDTEIPSKENPRPNWPLYLLARVADTIADSKVGETSLLSSHLKAYNDAVQGRGEDLPDLSELAELQDNEHEAELLRNVRDVVDGLQVYSPEDQERMLECLDIIVGGQLLDLERFGPANEGGNISALANEEELDDYTFRVAGCVGVFWTKMSLAHLMKLPPEEEALFMERGIRFGKALQMINILRDIPEDLRFGRSYIPEDPENHRTQARDLLDDENLATFRPLYDRYLDLTNEHLEAATPTSDDSRYSIPATSLVHASRLGWSANGARFFERVTFSIQKTESK